jgi:cell division protein FtsB
MSAVIRTRKRKNPSILTLVTWVVLGFFAIFFLVSYGQELLLAHDLTDKAAVQRRDNGLAADENARLKAQLQYYQSDKYIEQRAREDLNLRRADEEVIIPVYASPAPGQSQDGGTDAGTDGSTENAQDVTASAEPTPELANWQKWFSLFSPSP